MDDLLQGVQEGANADESALPANGGEFKMPSIEQLLSAIENMKDIPEKDKNDLRESLLSRMQGGEDGIGQMLGQQAEEIQTNGNLNVEMLMLFGLITFIALIFVFFGYKLYKSLVERERRREEKKRQKQQKKKK